MGNGSQFLDIILLGMVAAFILLRLRSVLGRRTGNERPRPPEAPEGRESNVIPLSERGPPPSPRSTSPAFEVSPAAAPGLERIRAQDPDFAPEEFVMGARAAYEMIVTAFAAGDVETLRPLLSPEVLRRFGDVIDQRKTAGEVQETTLVAINKADIAGADMVGGAAEVTVRFVSELISATRDSAGNVVAGNPNAVDEVVDIWTFSHDPRDQDPNWLLAATSAAA